MPTDALMLTVGQIAQRYSVNETTVIGWIATRQLRAVNVGRSPGKKRPRWRISQTALDEFEAVRTTSAPIMRAPRRRKPDDVIKFY